MPTLPLGHPTTDQSNDSTQVELCESMSLLGLHTETWVRDALQVLRRLKNIYIKEEPSPLWVMTQDS